MKTRRVMLLAPLELLLDSVRYDAAGVPIAGAVINGGWHWSWKDGRCHVRETRQSFACPSFKFVRVPDDWTDDYNKVMAKAASLSGEDS